MPINPFTKKKQERKEAEEQRERDLIVQRQREQEIEWREQQFQYRIRQLEQENLRREQERLDREAQLENERRTQQREHERAERDRLRRERERKDQEQLRLSRLKVTTPEGLRALRDLVRVRYELDMLIWSLRGSRRPDRPIVEDKMAKADAVLEEIQNMVRTWEENSSQFTPEEWLLAKEVKQRLLENGKRWWMNNPPWNEV